MTYSTLYRQYRPQFFRDVVGQDAVKTTLMHQKESGRISHAYLFSGTRGTGKTTVAKIFARAINCTNSVDGEPCGECESCKRPIDENPDIIEIDAASNNGVNEMRDLREKVRFAPLESRYKIYILDEAHMITNDAFNALLKTLEEPPSHVVFILATTEPQRLPATILSRCQRFEFSRLSMSQIVSHLSYIFQQSNVSIETDALQAMARAAKGSMRDALSIADQCIGFCGDDIHYEDVIDILGSMNDEFLFQIAQSMIDQKPANCLQALDTVVQKGRDLTVFSNDLLEHFRNIMLICNAGTAIRDLFECDDVIFDQYVLQSKQVSREYVFRVVETLSKIESDMKWMTSPRILLECTLLRLCTIPDEQDLTSLIERIELLENNNQNTGTQRKAMANPIQNSKSIPVTTAFDDFIPPDEEAPMVFDELPPLSDEKVFVNSTSTPTTPKQQPAEPMTTSQPTLDSSTRENVDADAQEIFTLFKQKQADAIQKLFTLYPWDVHLTIDNILELVPSDKLLPAIVANLSSNTDKFTDSISAEYPNIQIAIVSKSHASKSKPKATPAKAEKALQQGSLFADAAKLFGEENISHDD